MAKKVIRHTKRQHWSIWSKEKSQHFAFLRNVYLVTCTGPQKLRLNSSDLKGWSRS